MTPATVAESPTVRRIIGPTILLASGSYFDFEDPERSAFTIEDIAHGLAMTCRFAGQCSRYYSVAQHSVHVSHLVSRENAFAGLMHDAAEAFVGDMSKPLKDMLPAYRAIEKRVEAAVFDRFRISAPLPVEIKQIDRVMLATEQQQVMNNRDDWALTNGSAPANLTLPNWGPAVAKAMFLERFHELGGASA